MMRKFGLTFWFYFKENFNRKNLIIYGVILAVIIGGSFLFDTFSEDLFTHNVAIVNDSAVFVITPEGTDDFERSNQLEFIFVDSEAEAQEMLENGDIDDLFIIEGDTSPLLRNISSHTELAPQTTAFLVHLLTTQHIELLIATHDVPLEVVERLLMPVETSFESTAFDDDESFMEFLVADIMGQVVGWGLYFVVLMSGQAISMRVVSEKSSRVMEVMMGKVHPRITLFAKVITTFADVLLLLAVAALGTAISVALGFISLGNLFETIGEFISLEVALLSIVVFLLGYFIYIFMFAVAGAMASSVESLQSMVGPLTMLVMVPVFAPMFLDADSLIMTILSYIPIFSPFIIIERFLGGNANLFELGIIIVIMIAFAGVVLHFAARLYLNGISHTSEKVTLKDWKMLLQK